MSVDNVHEPASLDFGNVILTDSVTSRLVGEKSTEPLGPIKPEGLVNTASNDFTAERSSVALNSNVTIASPWLVSITSGEKRMYVSSGLLVSVADFTCRYIGNPRSLKATAFRTIVLPAASARNTVLRVHWPGSECAGNVKASEFDTDSAGSSFAETFLKDPEGLAKLSST